MRTVASIGARAEWTNRHRQGKTPIHRRLKGANIGVALVWAGPGRSRTWFLFLYLAFRALLGALVRSRRGLHVKDIELLVLRHELELLPL